MRKPRENFIAEASVTTQESDPFVDTMLGAAFSLDYTTSKAGGLSRTETTHGERGEGSSTPSPPYDHGA